ncbi:hypothetical protein OC610_28145, partial [Pseudomonas sp. SAICEU22]
ASKLAPTRIIGWHYDEAKRPLRDCPLRTDSISPLSRLLNRPITINLLLNPANGHGHRPLNQENSHADPSQSF